MRAGATVPEEDGSLLEGEPLYELNGLRLGEVGPGGALHCRHLGAPPQLCNSGKATLFFSTFSTLYDI